MPVGGVTPFAGAAQTLGQQSQQQSSGAGLNQMAQQATSGINQLFGGMQKPQQANPSPTAGLQQQRTQVPGIQAPAAGGIQGTPPPVDQQPKAGPGYNVNLEGFGGFRQDGTAKLGSAEHAMKSPKYAFANLAQSGQFGYNDVGGMLAELQKTNPEFYQGWEQIPGKEKIRFTGDPSQLHEAWKGVDEVDLVRNFTQAGGGFDPSKAAFWWGTSTPQERAQGGAAPQGPANPFMQQAILGTLGGGQEGNDYAARLQQQILSALQGQPGLAAIAQQSGLLGR